MTFNKRLMSRLCFEIEIFVLYIEMISLFVCLETFICGTNLTMLGYH